MNYFILPIIYAKNVWNAKSFPFISQNLFYPNGSIYDQTLILNPDFSLNRTALAEQGPPWLAASTVLFNIGTNMAVGATIIHIALWYGKDIWGAFSNHIRGIVRTDPHYEQMKKYKEVPAYWYIGIAVAAFIVALVTGKTEHSGLPWWALIVALIFGFISLPFYGAMYAITG